MSTRLSIFEKTLMGNRVTLPNIAENWYKAKAQRRPIQAVGNHRPIP